MRRHAALSYSPELRSTPSRATAASQQRVSHSPLLAWTAQEALHQEATPGEVATQRELPVEVRAARAVEAIQRMNQGSEENTVRGRAVCARADLLEAALSSAEWRQQNADSARRSETRARWASETAASRSAASTKRERQLLARVVDHTAHQLSGMPIADLSKLGHRLSIQAKELVDAAGLEVGPLLGSPGARPDSNAGADFMEKVSDTITDATDGWQGCVALLSRQAAKDRLDTEAKEKMLEAQLAEQRRRNAELTARCHILEGVRRAPPHHPIPIPISIPSPLPPNSNRHLHLKSRPQPTPKPKPQCLSPHLWLSPPLAHLWSGCITVVRKLRRRGSGQQRSGQQRSGKASVTCCAPASKARGSALKHSSDVNCSGDGRERGSTQQACAINSTNYLLLNTKYVAVGSSGPRAEEHNRRVPHSALCLLRTNALFTTHERTVY